MPVYCIIAAAARLPRAHREPPQTGQESGVSLARINKGDPAGVSHLRV
ncbi:hypothetical protein NBRC111894_2813 [Sporolactobacillus inulinus]|uniref:Uncharacterized protein n=1 Tax=Sporolactobacillus inulinus TaxID=2078 RepID=A0A4Y1ZDZ8_9BACL|nr:hypothetical protein NBRC111894_2813 [Sporolactobacillus inulinus]